MVTVLHHPMPTLIAFLVTGGLAQMLSGVVKGAITGQPVASFLLARADGSILKVKTTDLAWNGSSIPASIVAATWIMCPPLAKMYSILEVFRIRCLF